MKLFKRKNKNYNKKPTIDDVIKEYSDKLNLKITVSSKKAINSQKIVVKNKECSEYPKDKLFYVYFDFDWKNNFQNLVEQSVRNDVVSMGITLPIASWYFGKRTNRIINNGYKEIKKLIDKGVPSKNIIIDGLCITSAFGTKIAKKLFDDGIVVNLFNDRSFSKLTNHVSNDIQEKRSFKNSNAKNRLLWSKILDKSIIPLYAKKFNSTGDDFIQLYKANPDRINYCVYKSVKDSKGHREIDGTISHINSIHKVPELKQIRIAQKKPAKESISLIQKTLQEYGEQINDTTLKSMIQKLELKSKEYQNVKYQETIIKEINIESFNDAIVPCFYYLHCDTKVKFDKSHSKKYFDNTLVKELPKILKKHELYDAKSKFNTEKKFALRKFSI